MLPKAVRGFHVKTRVCFDAFTIPADRESPIYFHDKESWVFSTHSVLSKDITLFDLSTCSSGGDKAELQCDARRTVTENVKKVLSQFVLQNRIYNGFFHLFIQEYSEDMIGLRLYEFRLRAIFIWMPPRYKPRRGLPGTPIELGLGKPMIKLSQADAQYYKNLNIIEDVMKC